MTTLIQDRSKPLVYLITDRQLLPRQRKASELTCLIDFIHRAVAAGVDMIEIREPDLSAREVCELTETAENLSSGKGVAVLVNDRADIAACSGTGVHLTTRSLTADVIRAAFGPEMVIGASTHSIEEVQGAQRDGADFVVFGPVFETPSKRAYGGPVGLDALRYVAAHSNIPVLALGGIKPSNYRVTLDAGAAGVAAISMFIDVPDLKGLVATIKGA